MTSQVTVSVEVGSHHIVVIFAHRQVRRAGNTADQGQPKLDRMWIVALVGDFCASHGAVVVE
jgi:hypothetical protein